MTPQTVSLFSTSDFRLKFYSNMPFPSGTIYPAGMLRRIAPSSPNVGVVLPELYLLRAECKARLNDLAGAKADVETLRLKRMPAADAPVPPAIASSQPALVKYILEERIREFASWDFAGSICVVCLLILFTVQLLIQHIFFIRPPELPQVFTLRPERMVLRFPQKLMNQNPGMQNNP
jgi:hypothetical protein